MKEEKYPPKAYAILAAVFMFIVLGFYIFYEVVTGVCFPFCSAQIQKRTFFKNCTETVTAEVTSVEKFSKTHRIHGRTIHGTGYKAIFKYQYKGKNYGVKSIVSTSHPLHTPGETAVLRIDPDNPGRFYDPEIFKLPLKGTVIRLTAAGVHFTTLVILIVYAVKKAKSKLKQNTDQYNIKDNNE